MFWHSSGWNVSRVTEWMTRQEEPDETVVWKTEWTSMRMAAGKEFCAGFHDFGLAGPTGKISYPSGAIINVVPLQWGSVHGATAAQGVPGRSLCLWSRARRRR